MSTLSRLAWKVRMAGELALGLPFRIVRGILENALGGIYGAWEGVVGVLIGVVAMAAALPVVIAALGLVLAVVVPIVALVLGLVGLGVVLALLLAPFLAFKVQRWRKKQVERWKEELERWR